MRAAARVRLGVAVAALSSALSAVAPARGQAPPVTRNDYDLEVFQGPVVAPSRVTALAGATAAVAQGVDGLATNAAAPGVRPAYSLDLVDYDVTANISFPGAYGGTDFANRGERGDPRLIERTDRFLYLSAGAMLQVGRFGLGVLADALQYDVAPAQPATAGGEASPGLALEYARTHATAAYTFFDHQLVLGVGARIVLLRVQERGPGALDRLRGVFRSGLLAMAGAAPEVGAVIKPTSQPWRVGVTARAPVLGQITEAALPADAGVSRTGSFVTPRRIVQPWEIETGVALQLGPRPLNPRWIDPKEHEAGARATGPALEEEKKALRAQRKARYENWPHEHVLLTASLLLTGASAEAVALEGFLDQRRELVGRRVSIAPRFAAESEVLPQLLRMRAGVYLEPSRFSDGTPRQHFTFGGDVRLVKTSLFGILGDDFVLGVSPFLDLAPRYQSFGLGLGAWH